MHHYITGSIFKIGVSGVTPLKYLLRDGVVEGGEGADGAEGHGLGFRRFWLPVSLHGVVFRLFLRWIGSLRLGFDEIEGEKDCFALLGREVEYKDVLPHESKYFREGKVCLVLRVCLVDAFSEDFTGL